MSKKIQFFEWLSWRCFLIKMAFVRMFMFDKKAEKEVTSLNPSEIQKGDATPYETSLSSKFYDCFKRLDPEACSRLDFYFMTLVLGVAILILSPKLSLGFLGYHLFRLAGVGSTLMALAGFLMETINRSGNDYVTGEEYQKCKKLLHLVGESARKPLSSGMQLLIILMVFVDAAMISIVAMDYVADLPRKYALWGGVGVGFIVAMMLFFFTHEAGESIYRDTKRDELHEENKESNGELKTKAKELDFKLNFSPLNIFHPRRYLWLFVALFMISGLAFAAYGARYSTQMDIILGQYETTQQTLGIATDNPLLPPAVTQAQREAGGEIAKEHQEYAKRATKFALIILTMVFLGIQAVGIMMGYNHAFYDDQTKKAADKVKAYEFFHNRPEDSTVIDKANIFFGQYYEALVKAASENLKAALRRRQAIKMQDRVVKEKIQEQVRETQNVDPLSKEKPKEQVDSDSANDSSMKDRTNASDNKREENKVSELTKPHESFISGLDDSLDKATKVPASDAKKPSINKADIVRQVELKRLDLEEVQDRLEELKDSEADQKEIERTAREIKKIEREIHRLEIELKNPNEDETPAG